MNRLYNYILDAVTKNSKADRVKNVIGTAKFNYLKRIASDEAKLNKAIEDLLEDEFVRSELESEEENNDIELIQSDNDEFYTKVVKVKISKHLAIEPKLEYLLTAESIDFSKEKALNIVNEITIGHDENFSDLCYSLGLFLFFIEEYNEAEKYFSQLNTFESKLFWSTSLLYQGKFTKGITVILDLYSQELNDDQITFSSVYISTALVAKLLSSYEIEDLIEGFTKILCSNIPKKINVFSLFEHFYFNSLQLGKDESFISPILKLYIDELQASQNKESLFAIGYYYLYLSSGDDSELISKLTNKIHQILNKTNFNLSDINDFPFSIAPFLYYKLNEKDIDVFIEEYKKLISFNLENKNSNFFLSLGLIRYLLQKIDQNQYTSSNKKIYITNYKGLKKHSLQLSNTNIFIGFNGSGKTTLLQAIALGLLPSSDKDTKPIDFETFLTFGEEKAEISVYWKKDLISRTIEINPVEKKVIKPFFKQRSDFFLSEFILLGYGSNNFTRYINHNYDDIVNKMLDGDSKSYHVSSLFKDYSDDFYDPIGILNTLESYELNNINNKRVIAIIIKKVFLNALNQLIPIFKIRKQATTYKFFGRNSQALDLNHLSEGYRSVILLLTDILIRVLSMRPKLIGRTSKDDELNLENLLTTVRGTILIDEFNRHLHPEWQQVFIKNLRKVLPNVQFVLTTHSPVAVLGREEDEVQVLEINEAGEIEIKKHEGGTKNLDVSLTLLKYFGLESVVSPQLQENIDRYYELQIGGETEEELAELKELEKELEAANLGIPIYDARYLKFLEFLKKRNIGIRDIETIQDLDTNSEEWDELENELAELLD